GRRILTRFDPALRVDPLEARRAGCHEQELGGVPVHPVDDAASVGGERCCHVARRPSTTRSMMSLSNPGGAGITVLQRATGRPEADTLRISFGIRMQSVILHWRV